MLSSFDDYPIHQTSRPVAQTSTSDINHYDRYFFNGRDEQSGLFFAVAMGLYPNRHIADAAFSVMLPPRDRAGDEWEAETEAEFEAEPAAEPGAESGVEADAITTSGQDGAARRQVNVHASRRAPTDRADANDVGPIRVTVVEPLRTLRIDVDAPEQGLRAELTFDRLSAAIEEPHFRFEVATRVLLDYSRLTQFGTWSGWIEVDGERNEIEPGSTRGVRDRSWGVRPVGERGATGAPVADPQFFWLWAPVLFDGFATHFDVNELSDGLRWHESGFVALHGENPEPMRAVDYDITWRPGTRRMKSCAITLSPDAGESTTVTLEPLADFQMMGIGYGHPEWAHGVWKGELAVAGDRWDLPVDDPVALPNLHVQTLVRATTSGGLGEHEGHGVLEQLVIGRHAPTGLEGLTDGASNS